MISRGHHPPELPVLLPVGHADHVTLSILLVVLSWLSATCSVLWTRAHPRQPALGRKHPRSDWQTKALIYPAIAVGTFGGSRLENWYHWGLWAVLFVYGPFFVILSMPALADRWYRRSGRTDARRRPIG